MDALTCSLHPWHLALLRAAEWGHPRTVKTGGAGDVQPSSRTCTERLSFSAIILLQGTLFARSVSVNDVATAIISATNLPFSARYASKAACA